MEQEKKGRGQPPKELKDRRIAKPIYGTSMEWAYLNSQADAHGMSLSAYVRFKLIPKQVVEHGQING